MNEEFWTSTGSLLAAVLWDKTFSVDKVPAFIKTGHTISSLWINGIDGYDHCWSAGTYRIYSNWAWSISRRADSHSVRS